LGQKSYKNQVLFVKNQSFIYLKHSLKTAVFSINFVKKQIKNALFSLHFGRIQSHFCQKNNDFSKTPLRHNETPF
jgi:hypothetical protein